MKTKVMVLAVLMILAAASMSYAEKSGSGNAAVNAIGQVLKLPVTLLDKASNSLQNSEPTTAASEDVAVADVYNLDAETTG